MNDLKNAVWWFVTAAIILTATFVLGSGPAEPAEPTRAELVREWIVARNPQATIKDFDTFAEFFLQECQEKGLDYRFVMALIERESAWRPGVVGKHGEVGLMQVLPATAKLIAKNLGWTLGDLKNPRENLKYGLVYLKDQVDVYGMSPTALRAFNRGPANALQHRPEDKYAESVGLHFIAIVGRFPR
jgi:transglycosylase-like protein with SLT domain